MRIAVSRAPGAEREVTPLERGFTILTFGGPALFLLAQVVVFYETIGRVPRSRPMGLAALAI
jgi:hypothetical protein